MVIIIKQMLTAQYIVGFIIFMHVLFLLTKYSIDIICVICVFMFKNRFKKRWWCPMISWTSWLVKRDKSKYNTRPCAFVFFTIVLMNIFVPVNQWENLFLPLATVQSSFSICSLGVHRVVHLFFHLFFPRWNCGLDSLC